MRYKPIQGLVKAGYHPYSPNFRGGPIFAWEAEDGFNSKPSIEDFSRSLRLMNVESLQLDNIGTERPFRTSMVPEDKFEKIKRYLNRPLVIITKLIPDNDNYPGKLDKKYNVLLDSFFSIEVGRLLYVVELKEIARELKDMGCSLDDILLLKQTRNRDYSSLQGKYRDYIVRFLDDKQ